VFIYSWSDFVEYSLRKHDAKEATCEETSSVSFQQLALTWFPKLEGLFELRIVASSLTAAARSAVEMQASSGTASKMPKSNSIFMAGRI
jgi:hypothetical protein